MVDVVDVLNPFSRFALASRQMTTNNCYWCWVNFQEKHNSSLVSQRTLKASFYLEPAKVWNSVQKRLVYEHKCCYSYEVLASHKNIIFIFRFHFAQMVTYDFPPHCCDGIVVAQQNIIRVEFNHFLQANNNNVNILWVEIKQSVKILWFQAFRVNHVAVPCQYIGTKLLITAILCFFNDFIRYVVLKIISDRKLLFLA